VSNNVSSVVWPWREKSATGAKPEKSNPSAIKVIVQVAIMVCIGLLLYAWLKHAVMAFVVWGLAGVVLVSGFFILPVFVGLLLYFIAQEFTKHIILPYVISSVGFIGLLICGSMFLNNKIKDRNDFKITKIL